VTDSNDTIAAVATPFGEGAIALIRITGPTAFEVAGEVLSPAPTRSRLATLCRVLGQEGELIDEVLATRFEGPASYTGENLVEITCHGGIHVTRRVLEQALAGGARPARPGEFTERAFLNGKLDLTQAEAVMDLISAKSDLALRAANEQLSGRLGDDLEELRASVLAVTAHVEAYIDFPDEDIDPDTGAELAGRLQTIEGRIDQFLATADEGRILREGLATAIVGAPNAGKSSLLNLLAGHDRAIVTATPGTTRDTIEEFLVLRGIPCRLIDTAGIRETEDLIEKEGIERTLRAMAEADLVIEVVDGSRPPAHQGGAGESLETPEGVLHLLVVNKIDLGLESHWEGRGVPLSCVTGEGLDALGDVLESMVRESTSLGSGRSVAINARHRQCLQRALHALQEARAGLSEGREIELCAADLRAGLEAIGEVTGRTDTETLLGEIFSSFCIGK